MRSVCATDLICTPRADGECGGLAVRDEIASEGLQRRSSIGPIEY